MSHRKKPVELPSGVSAAVSGADYRGKGPKGVRSFTASDDVTLAVEEGKVVVSLAVSRSGRGNNGV